MSASFFVLGLEAAKMHCPVAGFGSESCVSAGQLVSSGKAALFRQVARKCALFCGFKYAAMQRG